MLIETNSYDLSVESYINGSLVKYEDVIQKYSFMKSGTYIQYTCTLYDMNVRNSGKGSRVQQTRTKNTKRTNI